MFSKTKKFLILTVFFAALLYGEGEGTSDRQDSGSSKSETVKEVRSSSEEIDQATKRGNTSSREHSEKSSKNINRNKNKENKEVRKDVEQHTISSKSTSEKTPSSLNNTKKVENSKPKATSSVKSTLKNKKSVKIVKAVEKEKEGDSKYNGKVIRFIATTDGKVIKNEDAKQKHPIASLTKVMNIMVALDQVDKGKVKLSDKVCFTSDVVDTGGSWLNAKAGDCFTLRDLLRAEIIYSANNAAYMVASYIGKGNLDNYVKLMNEKAKEFGMKDTQYFTPAGLPTSMTKKQMDISTAYDMYLLGRQAIKDERLREWMSEKELELLNEKGEEVVYNNRNHLLGQFGVFGLKTGFHEQAGYNMIVSSKIGNLEIISVSLGNKSDVERTEEQKKEFQAIEKNLVPIYKAGQVVANKFKIKNAEKKEINGILADNVYQLGNNTDYKFEVKDLRVTAEKDGISKGDVIGKLQVLSNNDKVVNTIDIVANNDYKQLSLFGKVLRFVTFGMA